MVVWDKFIADSPEAPNKKTYGCLWVFTVIKQSFWYGMIYYFHQMRITEIFEMHRNVFTGSTVTQISYFIEYLTHVWATLKNSLWFLLNDFIFAAI